MAKVVTLMASVLPAKLWRRQTMVIRPRDLKSIYARPDDEVRRLAGHGVLRPVAHGYWALPPVEQVEDPHWRPEIEALALGMAVADYGVNTTALMGASAARYHGTLPRALAVGIVAVPMQRPALDTAFGRIVFVKRQTDLLQLTRARLAMVTGYVTDIEQTMLDIAHRPGLGGLATTEAAEIIRTLAMRADWSETRQLAKAQRMPSAYVRARWTADQVLPEDVPILKPRRPVPGHGLRPIDDDAGRFGIVES
jgi:predicted transcriptional regulator of viral defense system